MGGTSGTESIVGDSGVVLPVGGTHANALGKAEDAAHTSGDVGVPALAVRRDSAAVGSGTDGDYSTLNVGSTGRLYTSATVDAALPVGDNNIGNVDVATLPTGSQAAATAKTADYDTGAGTDTVPMQGIALPASGGAVAGGTSTNPVRTDPTGTTTQPVSGTVTADTELPAAAALTDNFANPTAPGVGSFEMLWDGATWDRAPGNSTDGLLVNLGANNDVTVTSLPASTNTIEVVGDAAHDAAVAGNPVLIGAEARTSDGTAVTSGDAVRAQADVFGKQVVLLGALTENHLNDTTNFTNATAADLIAAQAAGIKIVVTSVLVVNGHATVATKVEVRAGTTVKIQGYAAAAGGGFSYSNPAGLFITAAAEAVTGRCATTGSDVDINVSGFTIKN